MQCLQEPRPRRTRRLALEHHIDGRMLEFPLLVEAYKTQCGRKALLRAWADFPLEYLDQAYALHATYRAFVSGSAFARRGALHV